MQDTVSRLHIVTPRNTGGSEDGTLLCFSHLRWDFVYQRPQHLLSRAAQSHRVWFFEEPKIDAVGPVPRLDLRSQACGVTVAVPVLPPGLDAFETIETQRALLDSLVEGISGTKLTVWYYTAMALAFSDHLEPDLCVYDCMDELSAFRGAPPELTRLERKLFARADLVFTGGESLYAAKRHLHPSVHAFPSSIDRAHFSAARDRDFAEPFDQAAISGPRLGFFGVIDERMDLGLVASLAALRPDWQFVMVGPVVKIDPAALPQAKNLHWLGSKSYAQLPRYLAGWSVGLMPFALNDSTRFISPTKTPEFLAAGVPVVSTPITDVVRPYGEAGLVEISRSPREVVEAAERLMRRPKAAWLARVDRHLAGGSWDRTWATMLARMRAAMRGPLTRERGSLQVGRELSAGV